MLAGSMANLVLPALGQDFGVPFASLQWVLVAYLLGITSLTVVAGRLGDRLGRRRLLLWGPGSLRWLPCCAPWPLPLAGSLPLAPCKGRVRPACWCSRWPWQESWCRQPDGLEHGIARHPVGLRHGARPLLRRPVDRRIWLAGSFLLLLP